ncbi:MAG: hypothetical protein D3922_04925, partial [Candidatus Electrothrix sp. AR1]|nr:hypothetical protein [Candidatus Electrothrix sp. AR1]
CLGFFFQAAEILKEEILGRLTEALFPKWSETLLLFFSLNKAATTDILLNLQKEVKEDSEEDEYFHILVMKMLDSEEYGIKDSDLGYWTRVCVEYIARADRLNERSSEKDMKISDNKGFTLIQQYFLSEDRKGRVEATRDVLHNHFDHYYQSIQEGEYNVQEGRCLENVLYFISSPPVLDSSFQAKIKKAVPVLLNRGRYGLQFLAPMELFVDQFKEMVDSVAAAYTINEAVVSKYFISKLFTHHLTQGKDRKHWRDVVLHWSMLLENLSIYSLVESLDSAGLINENVLFEKLYDKSSAQFQAWGSAENEHLWIIWYLSIFIRHPYALMSGGNKFRDRRNVLFLLPATYEEARRFYKHDYRAFSLEEAKYKKEASSLRKIASKIDRKQESIWWRVLAILYSANAFLYSNIEHDQNGNRYDYLWTTYEELQDIYTLLQNPEALYAHLEKNTTSLIDKPTFLEQYKEYDQQPYSMRHMAKTVLDRGKVNYPDSDNDKMLKKCQELVERVARQVEAEKNAEA